jgi:hypothetical protein
MQLATLRHSSAVLAGLWGSAETVGSRFQYLFSADNLGHEFLEIAMDNGIRGLHSPARAQASQHISRPEASSQIVCHEAHTPLSMS